MSEPVITLIVSDYGESSVRSRRRAAILSDAAELFCRSNHASLTMKDIADKLGMERRTLYGYYNNKLDLLVDSLLHLSEKLAAAATAAAAQDKPPTIPPGVSPSDWLAQEVKEYARSLFDAYRTHPFVMRYETFLNRADEGDEARNRYHRVIGRLLQGDNRIAQAVREVARAGVLAVPDGSDLESVALIVEQALRAYVIRISDRESFAAHYDRRNVDVLVDVLVRGLVELE